ncbi:hypothetical protein VKT23_008254 [Stygiomarasmius scandens]|uniref:Uncharacterized protein n=1 Tax=Marasmiellus scandens TaxID=2682957 RepID=A0ABR1JHP7_9AGAR
MSAGAGSTSDPAAQTSALTTDNNTSAAEATPAPASPTAGTSGGTTDGTAAHTDETSGNAQNTPTGQTSANNPVNSGGTSAGSGGNTSGQSTSQTSTPPTSTPPANTANTAVTPVEVTVSTSQSTSLALSTEADGGVVTVTSVVNVPVISTSSASVESTSASHSSTPFLQNKPAVIATFTVVGIVGFVILVILGTAALRRRRRRQLDIDALEASMGTSYVPPDDDEDQYHGIGAKSPSRNAFRDDDHPGYGPGSRPGSFYQVGGGYEAQGYAPAPMRSQTPMMGQVPGQMPMQMYNAPPPSMMLSHSNTTASQYSQPSATTYSSHHQYQDGYHDSVSAAGSTVGLLDSAGLGSAGTRSASGSADGHGANQTQESYASYYQLKSKSPSASASVTSGSAAMVPEGRPEHKTRASTIDEQDEQDVPKTTLRVANE